MSSFLRINRFDRSRFADRRLSGTWFYKADGGPSDDHWVAEDCTFNVACVPTSCVSAWEAAIIARSSRSVVQYFGQPAEADPELC
jgi:hypothetical protein